MSETSPASPDRREFLKNSTAATVVGAAASTIVFPNVLRGEPNSSPLKVGLIGCGGRGSGAASQAMAADDKVEMWAMGDVFQSKIDGSLRGLNKAAEGKINVAPERQFVGLDAYQKVLESGVDVVILTTPPGFRPQHFKAAVEAGKHVFIEKPMAVDATGVRSVMETAKTAKEKGLNVLCGFCWRYSASRRAAYERVHGGDIGDIRSIYATYYTGPVKPMPTADSRNPAWSDVEWQIRNWYNFSWLGGDSIVEQAVHSVDKIAWAMGDKPPIKAVGVGGRQVEAEGGNIFDHFHVVYEYENNVRAHLGSRQQRHCFNENADYVNGSKGEMIISGSPKITGENKWRWKGDERNMYQVEHDTLFGAIRKGERVWDGDWMATSTMLGLMGRMACYTGQSITWEQALNSGEDLAPDNLKWGDSFKPTPLPIPGVTKLVPPLEQA